MTKTYRKLFTPGRLGNLSIFEYVFKDDSHAVWFENGAPCDGWGQPELLIFAGWDEAWEEEPILRRPCPDVETAEEIVRKILFTDRFVEALFMPNGPEAERICQTLLDGTYREVAASLDPYSVRQPEVAPCDVCGEDVPEGEELGNDGEWFCPDCYSAKGGAA